MRYAETVRAKCGYPGVWGFVDDERIVSPSIVTPDGLVSSLMGPRMTGIEAKIREVLKGLPDGHDDLYVYGDPGIFLWRRPGEQLTEAQSRFNDEISRVRISVVQIFGRALQRWTFNGFKYGLSLESSPVAAFYMVAILLTNIKTCLDGGNEVSDAFG
ncbi:hypothetical protein V1524DRAFT_445421 [Lipomyces starkeyi]